MIDFDPEQLAADDGQGRPRAQIADIAFDNRLHQSALVKTAKVKLRRFADRRAQQERRHSGGNIRLIPHVPHHMDDPSSILHRTYEQKVKPDRVQPFIRMFG